jgi:phosphoribosyl-ATP pyrophosphohydrolase
MSQIKAGDIVYITFLKSKKRLASVQLSQEAWVYTGVENYDLGGINKTATIGSNTYSLPDDVVVISEGQRKEVMDIVEKDVLTVCGIGHNIYSISVEKGHGYLRLSNDSALIGGWIEVGNAVIQQITENMLLAVPEGSYQVILSNGNSSSIKEVVIERNKEVILDVGDVVKEEDKTGKILFSVDPSTATVSIDGEVVDISDEVELSYGIHKVHMEADGYQSLTKYIQVGSAYASISFSMEEGESEDSVSDNSSSDDVENAVTGNKVYIDAPTDVEVYLDGSYVGVAPVNFAKVTGSHTITLRKTGYESRSYTIYLYDDGEDVTYSFADLVTIDTVSGNSSTTSTSATSTKTSSATTTSSAATTTSKSSSSTSSTTTSSSSTTTDDTVSGNDSITSQGDIDEKTDSTVLLQRTFEDNSDTAQ